jgi:DNA polymerase-4
MQGGKGEGWEGATVAGGRWVLHLDMDAFFASVEQLTRPTLADRPVLVGGLGPRAVVAGASYQARVFGPRSAMPMGQARRLCPQAVVVPPRFALYQAMSERVMAVLAAAAPVLEPVSLDEAFLEPPDLAGADAAAVERFAVQLRADVRSATGLPASVGAGSGKQLAKIASELAKPDGLRVVSPAEQQAVLDPLPVRALWGVGPVAEAGLRRVGVHTIGQLAALDLREATDLLGTAVGSELHRLARGIDDRPVAPRGAAKQVSAETTFDTDLTAMVDVHEAVARMTESAHRRLLGSGRAARTVTVKIRNAAFTTASRSETAGVASTDLAELTAVAQRLARAAVPEGGVRLIGVSLGGLTDAPPPTLFGLGLELVESRSVGDTDDRPGSGTRPEPGAPPESDAPPDSGTPPAVGAPAGLRTRPDSGARPWHPGDDVRHPEHGHGWVQGAGHGRVTVRFETRTSGPGRARTLAADDPDLARADPLASLA